VREVEALGIVFFGGNVKPAAENVFPEVGEGVDGGCALDQRLEWGCEYGEGGTYSECFLQGLDVVEFCGDNFNALGGESFGFVAGGIAGDGPDLPGWVFEEGIHDSRALDTGCSDDGDDSRHIDEGR